MSFVLRSHRERYRQRARESFYRGIAIAVAFAAAVTIGYLGGIKRNSLEVTRLQRQKDELQLNTSTAEAGVTNLQANYNTLNIQFQQLTDAYKRDVPKGDLGLLTSLVKEQLDKGLAVERMAQIIRAAQPPQNCTQSVSKRFILSTPNYKGPDSTITFADGLITVIGSGEPSINSKQDKEAWFDPGKAVSITFTIIGGKKEVKTGLLPLHHTIIIRNKEYRFTISEGPRSFVVVTSDNCDYPESVMAPTAAYSTSLIDNSM